MGFGSMDSLEGYCGSKNRIENDKRADARIGIEGSGRTFFDKKKLPLGFMRTNHKNSKVSVCICSTLFALGSMLLQEGVIL